ncbi:MAG TPA: SAM-dependent methyltransferase, partial [Thermomicrobiales bacterium]|nr:SAM-dependent methyltransferase [Thermomicrobiales bacterium]
MTEPDLDTQPSGNPALLDLLREEIRTTGPITFARFMDVALYHDPHGYYRAPHRKPGRGGDFITSPELHPFFGFTLARQIADCWDHLGQPEHLVVREHGASSGILAYDIIAALSQMAPDVRDALDYRLIDVNAHRAAESRAAMAESGLGHIVRPEHPDEITPEPGIVLANEVPDALPVHRLIVRDGNLRELYVGLDEQDRFVDSEGELSGEVTHAGIPAYLRDAGVDVAAMIDGARLDVSPASAEWIRGIAANLIRGYAIVIDYGYDAPTLYREHRLEGTVRGYHQHTVTDDPYIRVGEQDLTAHVDFTWLAKAAMDAGMIEIGLTTQAEFLTQLGLGEWLLDLQQQP